MVINDKLIADALTLFTAHHNTNVEIAKKCNVSKGTAQKITSAYKYISAHKYAKIADMLKTGAFSGTLVRGVCRFLEVPFETEWVAASECYMHARKLKKKEIAANLKSSNTPSVQEHLSIPQRLEIIQNTMCNKYCRYPLLVSEFEIMQEQFCSTCPLMDLL